MDYFKNLLQLLKIERDEDRAQYRRLTESTSVVERRANGLTWYPIAIRGSELGRGDYLTVEVERTTHQDTAHQFRVGMPAVFFSNHAPQTDRIEGTIAYQGGNRLRITLLTDELPDWSRDGKLGVELLFDDQSYEQMEDALKQASLLADKHESRIISILAGEKAPTFHPQPVVPALAQPGAARSGLARLNESQQQAVTAILAANEVAVIHGPPGTGKTTTVVQAVSALLEQDHRQLLVVAPSNTAVDLLSEKLHAEGVRVVRVGNPARVSERLAALTLDQQMADHRLMRDIKKSRKQANEFKSMAHKYKRQFGPSERAQRKALFDEAHRIMKDVAQSEQYIIDEVLGQAQVITATLVGSNNYLIRDRRYHAVVIDEAGQALEPACWIPILKADKVVLAGDHCQLPPTIKSAEAAQKGLSETLLEKNVSLHPEAVRLLNEQYRMHERIMGYSSQVFYGGQLRAHGSVAGHALQPDDQPMLFIDTAGCGFEDQLDGTSSINPDEAAFLIRHLSQTVAELSAVYAPADFPSIAVISPYKQQLAQLTQHLLATPELQPYLTSISVNTIDSFQGQERDIVYISLTRSNAAGDIGFLSDIRRMNVAMTRARKKLVMVGDSATLSTHSFYADLVAYVQEHDAYRSAWEWL